MSVEQPDTAAESGYAISDLWLIGIGGVLTGGVVLLDGPAVLRVPLGVLSVLVLPGYALTAGLFPTRETNESRDILSTDSQVSRGITLLERWVLTIGLSITVVVLFGLVADRFIGLLTTEVLLGSVLGLTLVAAGSAAVRRRHVRADDRYAPAIRVSFSQLRQRPKPDIAVVLLAVSILFAGGAIAHSGLETDQSGSLTEFYFVSETTDADDEQHYPTTLTRGTPQSVSLAVVNSEGSEQQYTVVGELQRLDQQDRAVLLENRTELSRDQFTVDNDERHRLNTTVETNASTGNYRLVYLLYRGDPPQEPDSSNAYREIHLWVDVTEPTIGESA